MVGCQKFVHYIRMLCTGCFILYGIVNKRAVSTKRVQGGSLVKIKYGVHAHLFGTLVRQVTGHKANNFSLVLPQTRDKS